MSFPFMVNGTAVIGPAASYRVTLDSQREAKRAAAEKTALLNCRQFPWGGDVVPGWLACFLWPRCWVGVEAGESVVVGFAAGAFFSGDGPGCCQSVRRQAAR
jgi:hypothetical protein